MKDSISLGSLFEIIKKSLLMIVSIVISFVAVAFLVSYFLITPTYKASASIVINQDENVDVSNLNTAIQSNISLINTYKIVITSPVILDKVSEEMNLSMTANELAEKIEVSSEDATQIITLTATDTSAEKAAELVNTTTEVFQKEIPELMNLDNVKILSNAEVYSDASPSSPNIPINVAVSFLLGLVIAIGSALLLEYLDNTVKTEKDIEEKVGLPVIGIISHIDNNDLINNERYISDNRRQVRRDYSAKKKTI
ncbi:YveK family protein [Terribacillus saccharophilus]|uniref:YveK family protein n=1 Tax=Terribacillus saccharophilus TaxID=361277 RepID=UPI002989B353|nr:Wzz/FepE/Etk N-terminal domain-containing protein [Terribacillus saccharophilus]MCM3225251.1 Wzz/FepE/Etk N-terminal domain-containing protein [Terribacillus saccharophilus]